MLFFLFVLTCIMAPLSAEVTLPHVTGTKVIQQENT